MCAIHVHTGRVTGQTKARKLADTSYVIRLTPPEKCCNITKVVVGELKYVIHEGILVYNSA